MKKSTLQNNAVISVYDYTNKEGKLRHGFVATITLNNGQLVRVPISLKFYNGKLAYKLQVQLPFEEK